MGIFDKFKEGLSKTRNFLTQGLKQISFAFGATDEDLLEELELLFIQADLGQVSTDYLLDCVKRDVKSHRDQSPAQLASVLRSGLSDLLGEERRLEIDPNRLNLLLMVGVNGTGKTTTSAKLAMRYKKEGLSVLMAAADTFRAAAVEQLQTWANRLGVDCIAQGTGADPAAVVFDAIQAAKARKAQVLIVDTAGRLHNKKNLMDELAKMRRIIDRECPDAKLETLLVLDATTGQNALLQAKAFMDCVQVSGLVITKMDGNSKGGITVSVAKQTGLPIYLAGLGEKAEDLIDFHREAFINSLLPEDWQAH